MLKEFKTFALRGNVVDMAVGVIIGAAFGKIVDSLVKDVIMPPIGFIIGNVDFSELKVILKAGEPAVSLNYGFFINQVINFTIVAIAMFMLVRAMTKLQHKQPPPSVEKNCPECRMAIPIDAKRCGHCTQPVQ